MRDLNAPIPAETIHGLLDHQAASRPTDEFLLFGDCRFSFADLATGSLRLSWALAALGVRAGDRVAIMMSNRPEFLLTWFALSRLGALEVPVNTGHRGSLLHYILGQSKSSLLILEEAFATQFAEVAAAIPTFQTVKLLDSDSVQKGWPQRVVHFETIGEGSDCTAPTAVGASDAMGILYTSGTTGPAKGVVLPQAYALQQASIIASACRYTARDCLYNALPLFHGNAQFLSTVPALLVGARMVLARRFSASGFWEDIRRHRCTEFNYIGGILSILMKADPTPEDAASGMRVMMGAGAPASLIAPFENRFQVELIEGYGMSEIGIPFINRLDDRRAGSVGRLHGTHEAMLVDEEGRQVSVGEPGELLIRPNHFNGFMCEYFDMPDKTVEAWRDLWFHTGDVLRCDNDGYYYFVDRKKDALRRRGENISCQEVEGCVAEHAAVFESAAVGIASELGEDDVLICVTLRPGATLTPIELLRHCAGKMARFMVPRYVRILARLPKTPTERIQKYLLREAGVTADTYDREADPQWKALS